MKKVKLFLSLCLMCLSVAVLCMGVLAINSITYNITGTMTYNMIDGIALVNTRVYKVAEQKTTAELQTAIDGTGLSSMTFETIEQTSGYILSQKLDTKATLSENATQAEISSGSINITFGATDSSVYYYTYYIVINITNLSSEKALSATLTDNTTYTNINYYTNTSQSSIAKGETKNIVIGLSLSDTTVESLSVDINSCSLSISVDTTITFYIYKGSTLVSTNTAPTGITWKDYLSTKTYVETTYTLYNYYVLDDGFKIWLPGNIVSTRDNLNVLYVGRLGGESVSVNDTILNTDYYYYEDHTGGGSK